MDCLSLIAYGALGNGHFRSHAPLLIVGLGAPEFLSQALAGRGFSGLV